MKLLIADDEMQIRTGLAEGIDWKKLGIDEVFTAKNGIEALEIWNKYRTELVLTDIRMPGIDGLELSNKIIKQYDLVKIIVLSGYSDFEYARQAIKIGVTDYLLKPINIEELMKKVEQAKLEIERLRRERNKQKEYESIWQSNSLEAFIEGQEVDEEEIGGILRKYSELTLSNMMVYGLIEIDNKLQVQYEQSMLYATNYLEKIFDKRDGAIIYTKESRRGIVVEVASAKVRYQQMLAIKDSIVELNKLLQNQFKNTVSLVWSREGSWIELPFLHQQCEEGLKHRLYEGEKSVLFCEQLVASEQIHYIKIDDQELRGYIRVDDYERAKLFVEQIFQNMIDKKVTSIELVKSLSIELKNILVREIADRNLEVEVLLGGNVKLLSDIPEYSTIMRYCEWVDSLYYLMMNGLTKLGGERRNKTILKALYYINQHYKENITAEQVAYAIDKSKNYFSYLFKKEVGMSFVEYLNKVRIEKAKDLLDNTSARAYEITEMVGYSDYKYFSTVFKKIEGLSPSQYRSNKS